MKTSLFHIEYKSPIKNKKYFYLVKATLQPDLKENFILQNLQIAHSVK